MLRKPASLLILVALLVPALPGQEKGKTGHGWGVHVGPQAPSAAVRTLDFEAQREIAAGHAGWQRYLAEHPGWTALFDTRTGQPERAFGPGYSVTAPGPTRDDIAAVSMSLRDQLVPMFGQDPEEHELYGILRGGRIWYVHFVQKKAGFRVFNSGLTLRIDDVGRLVMWGGRFVDTDGLDPVPNLSPSQARDYAKGFLEDQVYLYPSTQVETWASRR